MFILTESFVAIVLLRRRLSEHQKVQINSSASGKMSARQIAKTISKSGQTRSNSVLSSYLKVRDVNGKCRKREPKQKMTLRDETNWFRYVSNSPLLF